MRRWRALLLVAIGWSGLARADDAPPPPPPSPTPLEAVFLPLKAKLEGLPPFLADTDIGVNFRSYYFDRVQVDDTTNEAWAFGGALSYRSGLLFDTFSVGTTFYGSAPLVAPADTDGTLLLKPGQRGYYVLGEAWGALRYEEYALLRGYRQLVEQSYINPQDNRMTPNTFEGVVLSGKFAWLEYLGGFLWDIKPRNSDDFISMAEQAGAPAGSDGGVSLFGLRLTPLAGLRLDVTSQYGVDTFNTVYAEAEYLLPLNEDWKLRFGAQFTDQRAVGDELLPEAGGTSDWNTQSGGARLQALHRDLTLTAAFSITADGNTIQSPWGSFPGYLNLIELDFNRAQETAVTIGAAYDFKELVRGVRGNLNFAWGWDAIDPSTGDEAPDRGEYDLTLDYRPPFQGILIQGLWLRFRAALIDEQNAETLGYQFRVIVNWDRDLI